MTPRRLLNFTLGILVLLTLVCVGGAIAAVQPESRETATKAMQNGNWKDAYEAFSKRALDPKDDPIEVSFDLTNALSCLQQLGRHDEIDAFREKVIAAQAQNWHLLFTAAQSFQNIESYGFIVAGQFFRGGHRGNDGKQVSCVQRDRVRSLQLFEQASKLIVNANANEKSTVHYFWASFADSLLNSRAGGGSWQFQFLTDLTKLPDYEDMSRYYGRGRFGWGGGYDYGSGQGAPVDEA